MKLLSTLHCHTPRCRHASGTDRDYCEAAVAAGFRVLGFSDHCPWPKTPPFPPPGYRSGVRMDPEEVPGYFDSLLALQKEFAGRLDIRIGFEVEHLPGRISAQEALFAPFPVDYLVLGQHFLVDEWNDPYCGTRTTDESRLSAYVSRCLEGLESGRYLYLAHPDVLNFDGPDEIYARHMGRLCAYLAEHSLSVEINLLGVADGRHYPSERFLRLAADAGLSAIVGVDAHRPEALLDADSPARAAALCARFGLPLLDSASLLGG